MRESTEEDRIFYYAYLARHIADIFAAYEKESFQPTKRMLSGLAQAEEFLHNVLKGEAILSAGPRELLSLRPASTSDLRLFVHAYGVVDEAIDEAGDPSLPRESREIRELLMTTKKILSGFKEGAQISDFDPSDLDGVRKLFEAIAAWTESQKVMRRIRAEQERL